MEASSSFRERTIILPRALNHSTSRTSTRHFSPISCFWKNKRSLMILPCVMSAYPHNILDSWGLWDHFSVCLSACYLSFPDHRADWIVPKESGWFLLLRTCVWDRLVACLSVSACRSVLLQIYKTHDITLLSVWLLPFFPFLYVLCHTEGKKAIVSSQSLLYCV
jgi:hypothetical protein